MIKKIREKIINFFENLWEILEIIARYM